MWAAFPLSTPTRRSSSWRNLARSCRSGRSCPCAAGEGVIAQGMGSLIEYLEPAHRPYCWTVRSGAAAAFAAALEGGDAGLNPETAAGFFALERAIETGRFPKARAVKAQLEGPATLAHCLFLDGVALARVPGWLDRLAGFLERQAAWQVRRLARFGLRIVFVLDEPAVSCFDGNGRAAATAAAALRPRSRRSPTRGCGRRHPLLCSAYVSRVPRAWPGSPVVRREPPDRRRVLGPRSRHPGPGGLLGFRPRPNRLLIRDH